MNRLGLTIVGVLVLVVALIGGLWYYFSTQPRSTPIEEGAVEEQKDTTKTDTGEYYDISATYPTHTLQGNPEADAQAQKIVSSFIEREIARFKKDYKLLELTPEDVEIQRLGERKYDLEVSYTEYESEKTVSLVFTLFADTLGAHPNTYYQTFTFSKETGELIALQDLFTNKDTYLETLSDISRKELTKHIAEVLEMSEDELDTSDIETGTKPVADNFSWFYLTDSELVLIFPPYQVGPGVLGTQKVEIPRSEISDLVPL